MKNRGNKGQIWLYEKLPEAFYFLHFDHKEMALSVFIANSCIPNLEDLTANNRLLLTYRQKLPKSSYTNSFKVTHGFDNCGIIKGVFGNFLRVSFTLRPMHQITKKKCEDCRGTGKDQQHKEYKWDCYSCHGLGKELINDRSSIRSVTASLSLLLGLLDAYDAIYYEDKDGKKSYEIFAECYKQNLYTIRTFIDQEMNGHVLGGSGSGFLKKKIADYFNSNQVIGKTFERIGGPYVDFPKTRLMMREAFKFLSVKPKLKNSAMGFDHIDSVCTKDGFFHLQTEGTNSCSLYASHHGVMSHCFWEEDDERGYPIHCHNVDTSFQQMILLIGLAGITEEIFSVS